VNFVAHLVVATAATTASPSSDLAIGAVLPDLASMAGTRFDRDRLPAEVVEGVMLHHRTDAAFHDHPWFVDVLRTDTPALEAAGLPRGAARACAHVGAELLLDGVLLENDTVAESLGEVIEALDVDRLGDLSPEQAEAWSRLFDRMRMGLGRQAYADPEAVAERLRFMLARRPRLALPPECEAALVTHLEWRRERVVSIAPSLVLEVTDEVRSDSGFDSGAA
jgi:acyl carrier protein phosphodiesterase